MKKITEENYLKAIYWIMDRQGHAGTNDIAKRLQTKASSVTDMVKKLSGKKLLTYTPYQGVVLTKKGTSEALKVIRKHRLWEVFLVEKLHFKWDEVHAIAEQMEHIDSRELVSRLDKFLGSPSFDPHGDPIPDENGKFKSIKTYLLSDLEEGDSGIMAGVQDSSASLLRHLENLKIGIGTTLLVELKIPYDQSMEVRIDGKRKVTLSEMICRNLILKKS